MRMFSSFQCLTASYKYSKRKVLQKQNILASTQKKRKKETEKDENRVGFNVMISKNILASANSSRSDHVFVILELVSPLMSGVLRLRTKHVASKNSVTQMLDELDFRKKNPISYFYYFSLLL